MRLSLRSLYNAMSSRKCIRPMLVALVLTVLFATIAYSLDPAAVHEQQSPQQQQQQHRV